MANWADNKYDFPIVTMYNGKLFQMLQGMALALVLETACVNPVGGETCVIG